MAKASFNKAKIAGICVCVPENFKLIDDDLNILYDGDEKQLQRIKDVVGLNKRHVVKSDTTSSDLCHEATKKLLCDLNVDKNQIDALVFLSQSPDYFQPSTASYLHKVLNLPQTCLAFDVNQGCSGYIYALWLAFMMVQTNSAKNVLVLVGETLSKVVNPKDSNVAPIFGDAGTATLVCQSDEEKSFFSLHSWGQKFDSIIQPKGAFRTKFEGILDEKILQTSAKRGLENLYMDGSEVFNFSISKEPEAIKEILEFSNISVDEIDYFVFHQANNMILKHIIRRAKLPEDKVPMGTISEFGNQSSASIPSSISYLLNKQVQNSCVKVMLLGFGAGLSWASCILDLDKIYCPDIIYFKEQS